MKNPHVFVSAPGQRLGVIAVLLALPLTAAFGHDSTEITTKAYVRTNCLELRLTLAAQTAELLIAADGHSLTNLSTAADVAAARPWLADSVARLFRIFSSDKSLVAVETNVTKSVEDHIEVKLIFPRPAAGPLRFDAVQLAKLPADEPYGALVTVVDLVVNVFLGQQLLTAHDRSFEVNVPALPPATSSVPASPPQPGRKP
jgi:hypothetical protein